MQCEENNLLRFGGMNMRWIGRHLGMQVRWKHPDNSYRAGTSARSTDTGSPAILSDTAQAVRWEEGTSSAQSTNTGASGLVRIACIDKHVASRAASVVN